MSYNWNWYVVADGDVCWPSWLRHYATSRKVAGSTPVGVIGIFDSPNPPGSTLNIGSTQPLTGMSTRGVKAADGLDWQTIVHKLWESQPPAAPRACICLYNNLKRHSVIRWGEDVKYLRIQRNRPGCPNPVNCTMMIKIKMMMMTTIMTSTMIMMMMRSKFFCRTLVLKVQDKLIPMHPRKVCGGEGIADWSASRSNCLTPAKGTLGTRWIGSWLDSRTGLKVFQNLLIGLYG